MGLKNARSRAFLNLTLTTTCALFRPVSTHIRIFEINEFKVLINEPEKMSLNNFYADT